MPHMPCNGGVNYCPANTAPMGCKHFPYGCGVMRNGKPAPKPHPEPKPTPTPTPTPTPHPTPTPIPTPNPNQCPSVALLEWKIAEARGEPRRHPQPGDGAAGCTG